MFQLSGFQRDLLYVIAGMDQPSGQALKSQLEGPYDTEINHGRLYPNLDSLVEMGLVEKSELDKRTNQYELTAKGHDAVVDSLRWTLSKFLTDDERVDEVQNLIDELR